MRIVKELSHRDCKITLFAWNNRYIIKVEQGLLEQTFKIDQFDVASEDEVIRMLDDAFIAQTVQRFSDMYRSLMEARQRID